MKEFDGNGSKCVHRLLCWKEDVDEASPRNVTYECNACKKEFVIEIDDETYWDIQDLV